ncbi:probable long-chain-alcohol O-fatty-acyltransferase 1 [Euphorbia lathyris]|uniref:probable long-chain-alcohol O-fatty-acyltransferase 1 n=1 Tax=Euphorbia lathyris TaxID=212925 RepID=UPI003313DE8D
MINISLISHHAPTLSSMLNTFIPKLGKTKIKNLPEVEQQQKYCRTKQKNTTPTMEGAFNNIIKVYLSIFASLSYCYFIASNIAKGKFRLISLLPVIVFFSIVPFFFSYLFPTAIASVFISWSANFKLILFAFDNGPLASTSSLLQFISIAILPIRINNIHPNSPPPAPKFPQISTLIWPIKVFLFAILVKIDDYKDRVDHKTVLVMYCFVVYLLVEIVFGIGNALVCAILNMELDPPSDQPYFSTSLQDFWGRRWNLMITNLLRHTVYKPTRQCLGGVLGKWSPPVAVLATFVVSGLMHELLFYHVTRVTPTWEVTCFFLLHGICLVVENDLKSKLRGKWKLHWLVSGPLTVGFVVVTAIWLFFPPVIRTNATGIAMDECKVMLNYVTRLVKKIFLVLNYGVW